MQKSETETEFEETSSILEAETGILEDFVDVHSENIILQMPIPILPLWRE